MNINASSNINAERLFDALQNNCIFVKNQYNDIEKVELDYQTLIQLQTLLSNLKYQDKLKQKPFVSLADGFRNLKNADKMDFDIDFDHEIYHQVADFSDLETLFDD